MLTIYEIRDAIKEKQPYYFSHDTLHFFGQSMESFIVKKSPSGRIFIYAPSYWIGGYFRHKDFMGYTFMEFFSNDLIKPNDFNTSETQNNQESGLNYILEYIASH